MLIASGWGMVSASHFQDQVLGPPSIVKFVFLWSLQVFISWSYVTCPCDPRLITGKSRALILSRYRQFGLEEVTAAMVGDALLALMAKSGGVSAYNGPSSTLTLNNPFWGKCGWAIYFYVQFYSNANIPGQISRHRNVSRSQGNVAWIVPTMVN